MRTWKFRPVLHTHKPISPIDAMTFISIPPIVKYVKLRKLCCLFTENFPASLWLRRSFAELNLILPSILVVRGNEREILNFVNSAMKLMEMKIKFYKERLQKFTYLTRKEISHCLWMRWMRGRLDCSSSWGRGAQIKFVIISLLNYMWNEQF